MSVKNTPGPWTYNTYNHILDKDGREICAIPDHPTDGEYTPEQVTKRSAWYRESEANAYLIAAAPEMLRELRLLVIECPCGLNRDGITFNGTSGPDGGCTRCASALRAIAKAEGTHA